MKKVKKEIHSMRILAYLVENGVTRADELRAIFGDTMPTLSRTCTMLVNNGLADRVPYLMDMRKMNYVATDKGEAIIKNKMELIIK